MGGKYFISTRPWKNGSHIVHREGCPFLPEQGKRIFLGIFQSLESAIKEGQKCFKMPGRCVFCAEGHDPGNMIHKLHKIDDDFFLISSEQLKDSPESVLLCCIN